MIVIKTKCIHMKNANLAPFDRSKGQENGLYSSAGDLKILAYVCLFINLNVYVGGWRGGIGGEGGEKVGCF